MYNSSEDLHFKLWNHSVPLLSTVTWFKPLPHSSLISTYEVGTTNPSIITEIDLKKYKFKDFTTDNNRLGVCFPEKGKHISFDGCNYFICSGQFIIVDFFETLPKSYNINCLLYKPCNTTKTKHNFLIEPSIEIEQESNDSCDCLDPLSEESRLQLHYSPNTENIFTQEFFDDFIYQKKKFNEIFPKKINHDTIFMNNTEKAPADCQEEKKELVLSFQINQYLNESFIKNRFTNVFQSQGFLNREICNWLLNDIQHNNDVVVKDIQQNSKTHSFLINMFDCLIHKIKTSYSIHDNSIKYNITRVLSYCSKFENTPKKDNTFFTIRIPLINSMNILFENGVNYNLNAGDLLLYCSKNFSYMEHKVDKNVAGLVCIEIIFYIELIQ